ncbi:outer membrane protein assembly factor BamB family protein [Natrinema salaciae]|uniref:Outer membrane protein assembly factor BamB, contains PQQ-like beta-propeller repeat n=1 Tax=Natrinema salaciae TaxID=1186196 RepID=A0A1H9J7N1_9EURY|nr:PQQ-binding-like beta-propeller repeat protein [Natrinema salaciae]SEQ82894.1 Outer membrane protein assembly factor BamB, contains PQQ-like beta-propeller repeat [Natrinema salaciae]
MTEWTQYKADPHNSGLRRDLGGPARVAEAWTVDLVGPPGSPVLDRDTVYVGTTRGNCYALERETGRRRWVFETQRATDATPVVTRERLYLGTGDGAVYALDPATGDERWQVELPDSLASALALSAGRLYAGHAAGLSALEAETGTELWTHETESAVVGCPAIADGREGEQRRSGLDEGDGVPLESMEPSLLEAERVQEPDRRWGANEERVFAGTTAGTVLALAAETGEEAWTAPATGSIAGGPTIADGRVYVGDEGGTMLALDAGTGQTWFTYEIGDGFTTSATVLAAAETTFVGAEDGYLHVTDTTVGRRKLRGWLFSRKGVELDGPIRSCPVVAGDVICVGDASGSLYGIDADDPEPLWRFAADDAIRGTPALGAERLYVGSDDERLYCLEWDADEPRR